LDIITSLDNGLDPLLTGTHSRLQTRYFSVDNTLEMKNSKGKGNAGGKRRDMDNLLPILLTLAGSVFPHRQPPLVPGCRQPPDLNTCPRIPLPSPTGLRSKPLGEADRQQFSFQPY